LAPVGRGVSDRSTIKAAGQISVAYEAIITMASMGIDATRPATPMTVPKVMLRDATVGRSIFGRNFTVSIEKKF
jgi:hypothetical protein